MLSVLNFLKLLKNASVFSVLKLHLGFNVQLETQIFNGHTFKDYQHIENTTISGLTFFTQSEVSCCIYDVENTNPSVTSEFIYDLEHLSDEYVSFIYRK